jgi:hypothetical protein
MENKRRLKPLPKRGDEGIQEQLTPSYAPKAANDGVFNRNRGNDLSQKLTKDDTKNFTVGLKDIDEAVKYYFENVIKPSVIQNGAKINVPVMFGNQEIWKQIQTDGYIRDTNGKLMYPLISFNRVSIEKNRNLGNKLDANKAHLYQVFEKKYTKQNYYDAFSVLNNRIPVSEFVLTVVPDYVTLIYECVVYTEYMEQMNPIIESINFASDAYWGDMKRFKFRARIDSISTLTQLAIGEERTVKSTFNLVLNGYIIPETAIKDLSTKNKFFSKAQIVFDMETTYQDLEQVVFARPKTPLESTSVIENTINTSNYNNITINNYGSVSQLELAYLNTTIVRIAPIVTSNTVTFTGVKILQVPTDSTLSPTSKLSFMFFVNGQYIPASQIVSIDERGTDMVDVVFDTNAMGYSLEASDEISARGKWMVLDGTVDSVLMTENGYYILTESGQYLLYQ